MKKETLAVTKTHGKSAPALVDQMMAFRGVSIRLWALTDVSLTSMCLDILPVLLPQSPTIPQPHHESPSPPTNNG